MQCLVPWGGYVYMNIVVGMIHGGIGSQIYWWEYVGVVNRE